MKCSEFFIVHLHGTKYYDGDMYCGFVVVTKFFLFFAMQPWARVLSFWFAGTKEERNMRWWSGTPEADEAIRSQFSDLFEEAVQGKLNDWIEQGPQPCLALIITLDQFSLQLYRDQAKGYDLNALAVRPAMEAIKRSYDVGMTLEERLFTYLPFEHAENLELQEKAMQLFEQLLKDFPTDVGKLLYDFAKDHYDAIKKYGRFPGRNKAYGRISTPAEEEYLAKGGLY